MARYGDIRDLQLSEHAVFKERFKPSSPAPLSGIYQCIVCEKEATSEEGKSLPPQDHHTHPAGSGPIVWRLVAFAQHHRP